MLYFIKYPIKLKTRFDRIIMYIKLGVRGETRTRKTKEALCYLQRTVGERVLRFH